MRIQVSMGRKRKLPEIYKRKNDSGELSDKRQQISVQDPREGSVRARHICGSGTDKALTSPSACISDTLDSVNNSSNITRASSRDVDSERSCRVNYSRCSITSNLGCKRITVGPERVNLSTDGGQGAAIVVGGNFNQTCSHLSSPAATFGKEEDDPKKDQQLSPAHVVRAAILKERFAELILKAKNKTLLNQGESVDPVRMKKEKHKLVKKQQEVRKKAEADLKMQREKQREAARLALQKMERTVEIDNNSEIRKSLK